MLNLHIRQQKKLNLSLFRYPVLSERPVEPTAVQGESKLPKEAASIQEITATSNKHDTHCNTRLGLSKKAKRKKKNTQKNNR
jgi:hypothetical protein